MKKYISFGIGIVLFILPVFAVAQTTNGSSNSSLIAVLTTLVQKLEQELQQLLAARSSPSVQSTIVASATSPQPVTSGMTTDVALVCNASAGLKRGDTDATTAGKVSQLQKMLGINPVTGYYAALTAIGYTNTCVGGNSQPTSVAGMSLYTDPAFGFSFWYPRSWTVTDVTGQPVLASVGYNGPTANKVLRVSDGSIVGYNVYLYEYRSPDGSIRDYPSGTAGNDPVEYFFSSPKGAWMTAEPGYESQATPANMSQNTMGGLHLLNGGMGRGEDTIIPLSAYNFVIAVDGSGLGSNINYAEMLLAKTLVATDPSVAISVSTAQQIATIQAEASAYGVNASNSESATIDQNSLVSSSSNPTIAGTATNIPYIGLWVSHTNTVNGPYIYTSNIEAVANDKWTVNVSNVLPVGVYKVVVYGYGDAAGKTENGGSPIVSGTLTITASQ